MKKFLISILWFSLAIIIILAALEIFVRGIPNSYSEKDKVIHSDGKGVSTLILGSSHTYYGLMPSEFGDSTFNLANISQTPEYDLLLLKHYLPLMPNLKRVITSISYFTYVEPNLGEGEDKLAIWYNTRMGIPPPKGGFLYNFEIYNREAFFGRLRNIVMPKPSNHCDSTGFGVNYSFENRDPYWENGGEERARPHTLVALERWKEVVAVQNEFIDLCRKHGIEPVFITTPGWITYRSHLDPNQLRDMRNGVAWLVDNKKVRYIDFLSDKRFINEDFYDCDHLCDRGARKLSKILADTLRQE